MEKLNKWERLTKALAEIRNLELDSEGYNHYKYTSLPKVLDHFKPILAKYELAILQECTTVGESVPAVITKVICSEGVLMETAPISASTAGLSMKGVQASGAVYTYLRRYALTALLGIAGDADIDANIDTKKTAKTTIGHPAKPSQINKIASIAKKKYPDEMKEFIQSVAKKNNLPERSDQLTEQQAEKLIKLLEEAK